MLEFSTLRQTTLANIECPPSSAETLESRGLPTTGWAFQNDSNRRGAKQLSVCHFHLEESSKVFKSCLIIDTGNNLRVKGKISADVEELAKEEVEVPEKSRRRSLICRPLNFIHSSLGIVLLKALFLLSSHSKHLQTHESQRSPCIRHHLPSHSQLPSAA